VSLYQPLWRDGRTEGDSIRDAEIRYQAIVSQLSGLPEGFSVLDVGAQSGYFAVRMAAELGARAVAADGDVRLAEGLKLMGAENKVHSVHTFLAPGDITGLGPFDVGLCLSVLHHVDWWWEMLTELLDNCSMVFVETAMPEEVLDPKTVLRRRETLETVRGLAEGNPLCLVPGYDKRVLRPTYRLPGRSPFGVSRSTSE